MREERANELLAAILYRVYIRPSREKQKVKIIEMLQIPRCKFIIHKWSIFNFFKKKIKNVKFDFFFVEFMAEYLDT